MVTANARAARSLRLAYAAAQRAAGRSAWPTPAIHEWEGWLGVLWKQHLQNDSASPLLLSHLQERAIWKRITRTPPGDPETVAKLAADAWRLLSDLVVHNERRRPWTGWGTTDAAAFQSWASSFDRDCQANAWISRADLPELLVRSLASATVPVPTELLLVGFDRIIPSRQSLIDAFRSAGAVISMLALPAGPPAPQLIEARDIEDEIVTCAWWTRRILEANPAARIAIIVPDVEGLRSEIERHFRRVLMPRSIGIEAGEEMPFEFSLGRPLASAPVIGAALLLLRWLAEPLDQPSISWLAISGFIAAEDELTEMATLDAEIRKSGRIPPRVSLADFSSYASRSGSPVARRFLARLRGVHVAGQAGGVGSQKRTFSDWVEWIDPILHQARWPGARTLETAEFQAVARWEKLTGEAAGLSFDGGRVSYEEFVTVLDRYARETIFAPESRDSAAQIMGVFEAAGQEFDALWFLGADEGQWPTSGLPHPLLPIQLQRKAGMPHTSGEAEWRLALNITRRIAATAPVCVFSHAQQDDAGDLRPSALLHEAFGQPLTALASEQLRATLNVPEEPAHRRLTRIVSDDSSLPWPRELQAGGAEILRRQSACAFQSFAVRRLGAGELGAAERGLNPRERGTILHRILEAVWSATNPPEILLRNREDLIAARAGGRLGAILTHHIREVFEQDDRAGKESTWTKAYIAIEQARLHALLLRWLDYELRRTDFSVEEREKEFLVQINGLGLNLRVDRIDKVEGGRLILDYKTGKVAASMWDGERPDDPQLPLYGVFGPVRDLRGLLFGQLRPGDMTFVGRAEDARETLAKDLSSNSGLVTRPLTREIVDEWARTLGDLAERFLAGDAAVAPKSYPKTCRYCALTALCRVSETSVILAAEDNPDFGGDDGFADEEQEDD